MYVIQVLRKMGWMASTALLLLLPDAHSMQTACSGPAAVQADTRCCRACALFIGPVGMYLIPAGRQPGCSIAPRVRELTRVKTVRLLGEKEQSGCVWPPHRPGSPQAARSGGQRQRGEERGTHARTASLLYGDGLPKLLLPACLPACLTRRLFISGYQGASTAPAAAAAH